jgi:hypothetical protein
MDLTWDYAFEPAQDDWSRLDNLLFDACGWLAQHQRICCALVCAFCLMPLWIGD